MNIGLEKVNILDCTLRDGGYVNDFTFGKDVIRGFLNKINKTNVECVEIGFLKGDKVDEDKTCFPNMQIIKDVLNGRKCDKIKYFVMYDTSSPLDLDKISKYDGNSVDGVRVIFKNNKIDEGYDACKKFIELGYLVSANFVSTNVYSDEDFAKNIKRFNELDLFSMAIVDTFGSMKNDTFLHFVKVADENMRHDIALTYHGHNNLQQAYQNAISFVNLNLDRTIIIDASVFGMGRGAGNLNIELFAEYLNKTKNKKYHIVPMLEIMDEYLQNIYKTRFWGYSLPLYISGTLDVHPNYAIYLAEKNTLTEKSLYEIMSNISARDKLIYKKDVAEKYYLDYMNNYINDSEDISKLEERFRNKKVLALAPGQSINENSNAIKKLIEDKDVVSISLNFYNESFKTDFIFSSNMRRYRILDSEFDSFRKNNEKLEVILTSNMREAINKNYNINFYSIAVESKDVVDNAGLMVLKLMQMIGVKEVLVAGMDGYSENNPYVYNDMSTQFDFSNVAGLRNKLIKKEIDKLQKYLNIKFVTKSLYDELSLV